MLWKKSIERVWDRTENIVSHVIIFTTVKAVTS